MDELLRNLGGIASRVRLDPTPGTATLRDLIRLQKKDGRIYELVDGTLVAKPWHSRIVRCAILLATALQNFLRRADIGSASRAAGPHEAHAWIWPVARTFRL